MKLRHLNEMDVDVWPAFTDFVTSVLFIVVLFIFGIFFSNISRSLVASDTEYRAMQQRMRTVQEALNKIPGVHAPAPDVGSQRIILQVDKSGAGGVLFDKARATLQDTSKIDEIMKVLQQHSRSYKTIEVVGHADSDKLTDTTTYKSNWELSAARAGAVVNHILSRQAALPPHQRIEPWRFSANGNGEFRPYNVEEKNFSNSYSRPPTPGDARLLPDYVYKYNADEASKSINRRIEIILTYSLATQDAGTTQK